ncbi:tetratricopeptide repeat protein [uncultured Roseibium sp.]|uniref:tetratricopeptide repeat protein n=1 Tax=uncultured Roseibium sp. TaxID=1936171 RepID=UPI002606E2ED|nr:tetratricopeptide repeat protein [uncultured Roseibium sp.]
MLLVDDRLKAARDHAAAGRHDNAVLLFESVLDVSPGNVEALAGLIEARLAGGDLEAAQALLLKGASLSGQDVGLLTLAAKVGLLTGDEKEAERLVDRALALDPFHIQAVLLKSEVLADEGRVSEVEDLLNKVRARTNDPRILEGIASLYFKHGLFGPALLLAQEAHDLSPLDASSNALVGRILRALGDHGKATLFLETAHLQDPSNLEHLIDLADNSASTGLLSEARRIANRAIALYPAAMPAWLCHISIRAKLGEAAAALKDFAPVAKAAENRMDAMLTLAAAYRLAGQPEKTVQLLDPLLKGGDPLEPAVRARLVNLLHDAYLSAGEIEKVPPILSETVCACLGISNEDSADLETFEDRLDKTAMVIDPGLNSLEFMVMARFIGKAARGFETPVIGPSGMAQLAGLLGYRNYLANDTSEEHGAKQAFSHAVPVSRLLGLPAEIRGGLHSGAYLPAREQDLHKWRHALQEFPRPWIGIAWNETPTGLALDPLLKALPSSSGTLVSTIWDQGRSQLQGHSGIIDAGKHFQNLEDLAALLQVLDLVVGPDGLVLHAAGAAGTPGLALVENIVPWYWHAEDGKSIWYPSIDVIRAPRSDHWSLVMPMLAQEMAARMTPHL